LQDALAPLLEYWAQEFGLALTVEVKYACDIADLPQRFIKDHRLEVGLLFKDMNELRHEYATLASGERARVPDVDGIIWRKSTRRARSTTTSLSLRSVRLGARKD
jgi:hypothetical protein